MGAITPPSGSSKHLPRHSPTPSAPDDGAVEGAQADARLLTCETGADSEEDNLETLPERSAREAGELGLSVLGISMGELLKGQLAYEVDQSRLRAAFECLESSLRKLAATNFGLLSRLRSPPAPLLHVLEPVLLMLRLDLPSPAAPPAEPSLVCPVASWPTASVLLSEAVDSPIIQQLHRFPLSALDPELVELLDPYFAIFSHAKARKTAGILSHLWSWVSAVGVIGDSPFAALPDEGAGLRRSSSSISSPLYSPNPLATSTPTTPSPSRVASSVNLSALEDLSNHSNLSATSATVPISSEMQDQLSSLKPRAVDSPPLIMERRNSFGSGLNLQANPSPQRFHSSLPPALRELDEIQRHSAPKPQRLSYANAKPEAKCEARPKDQPPAGREREDDDDQCCAAGCAKPAFGDLQPLKFLGAGAFANVFMCRDMRTGQVYALKSILKALVIKNNKQHQVMSERAALEGARHPCIVELVATYADKQQLYLLMEISLGGELFALLSQVGVIAEAQARYYAASLTLALGHLHSMGYMYRDVKPENLLLTAAGRLKLCDLGIAKRAELGWTLVGTPDYTAPEVILGKGATRAVDWWQLGILVFEMVTGSLPFEAADGKDASLFRLIARGVYTWPAPRPAADGTCSRSSDIESIVSQLLRHGLPGREASTPTMASAAQLRLGSGIGDMCDVQAHPWWEGLDWLALEAGLLPPPFIPQLASDDDDSNFGPLESRGEPVLDSPEYDIGAWDAFFEGW